MKKGLMKVVMLSMAIVMAVGVCVGLTACGEDNSKDLEYIKEKGTLVLQRYFDCTRLFFCNIKVF